MRIGHVQQFANRLDGSPQIWSAGFLLQPAAGKRVADIAGGGAPGEWSLSARERVGRNTARTRPVNK
jgi:hypothetical protein